MTRRGQKPVETSYDEDEKKKKTKAETKRGKTRRGEKRREEKRGNEMRRKEERPIYTKGHFFIENKKNVFFLFVFLLTAFTVTRLIPS